MIKAQAPRASDNAQIIAEGTLGFENIVLNKERYNGDLNGTITESAKIRLLEGTLLDEISLQSMDPDHFGTGKCLLLLQVRKHVMQRHHCNAYSSRKK